MPIASCPKCATNLRFPDGAAGALRCPKCQTVFTPPKAAPAAPAFEVVDDEPKPAAKPASPAPPARPAPPVAVRAKPAPEPEPASDFEVVDDEPKSAKKKVVAKDADDDEDDDRPRSKRKVRDDDDDDEDDQPRRKKAKKKRDDDDDRPRRKAAAGGGTGRAATLMLTLSLGLYAGTFALLALFAFLALLGMSIPSGLLLVTGIVGLANWAVALVGSGLAIGGPARSRGIAVAATAIAAVHLVLGFVVANDTDSTGATGRGIMTASAYNKADRQWRLMKEAWKNPSGPAAKELAEEQKADREEGFNMGRDMGTDPDAPRRRSSMRWSDLATAQPAADQLLAVLCYHSKFFSNYLLSLLAGLVELARTVLIVLLIRSLAQAARDGGAESKARIGAMAVPAAAGIALLVLLLTAVMIDSSMSSLAKKEAGPAASRSEDEHPFLGIMRPMKNYTVIGDLLIYLLHGGALVAPALAGVQLCMAGGRKGRYHPDDV